MATRLATIKYEYIWWRGLLRCLRRGSHFYVPANDGQHYCWDCFYRYYYENMRFDLSRWIRTKIGSLV